MNKHDPATGCGQLGLLALIIILAETFIAVTLRFSVWQCLGIILVTLLVLYLRLQRVSKDEGEWNG